MDFDSSSKFISSLAKFLQSLCNGYVEFNSGVEVIGHIYLSVDTGKKIDYILNEKVCKTDENSVTFISNSFHAQPAEKPKPPAKTPPTSDPIKPSDNSSKADDEDIIIMEEPESKNVGTIPPRNSFQQHNSSSQLRIGRPSKRSFNQSFPSSHRHSMKQIRCDPSPGSNGAQLDTDSLHSESNSSSNFLPPQLANDTTIMAATESDLTHLSKVFPQTFSDPVNNESTTEERDVKPQLDSDFKVIQVKQEYDQSVQGVEEEPEMFDDSQDQNTTFPGMPYDQYYAEDVKRGQRSDYGHIGGMAQGEFFPHGAGPSGDTVSGDSSDLAVREQSSENSLHKFGFRKSFTGKGGLWQPGLGCPVPRCSANVIRQAIHLKIHWTEKHEEIVAKYHCSMCQFFSKRKSNLFQHFRLKHNCDITQAVGKVEYQHNREFQDPYPFTLDYVLGKAHM